MTAPVAAFQSLTDPRRVSAARRRPLDEKLKTSRAMIPVSQTSVADSSTVRLTLSVLAFQKQTLPSYPADARKRLSGRKVTFETPSAWPCSVACSTPVAGHHILTVASSNAEASKRPFGEKAGEDITSEWPARTSHAAPVLTRQSLMVLSLNTEARTCPLGENHRSSTLPSLLSRVPCTAPVERSHSLTSFPAADASSRLSGENATAETRL